MKNLLKSAGMLFFVVFALTGCKKDGATTTKTGVSAEVTAANFGFDGIGAAAFKSTTAAIVKVGPIVTISAIQNGTTNAIKIVLSNVSATGTFSLDKDNTQGNGAIITKDSSKPTDTSLNYSTDNASGTSIGGGQVKITSLTDTQAEGTFYITAYNAAGKAAFAGQGTFKGAVNK